MFGIKTKERPVNTKIDTAPIESRKFPKSVPLPKPCDPMAHLNEYKVLAEEIGFVPPDMKIEAFKSFLVSNDIPVFNLHEVVKYMDNKAKDESKQKCGWEWRPLRAGDSDIMLGVEFGTPCSESRWSGLTSTAKTPASDYFKGPRDVPEQSSSYGHIFPAHRAAAITMPYDRAVPIHALRKVSLIEKSFKGDVGFLVNDYALAPHIVNPDPFLMVVIPNPKLNIGIGRFVIDFWDEPGFGIEQMIK